MTNHSPKFTLMIGMLLFSTVASFAGAESPPKDLIDTDNSQTFPSQYARLGENFAGYLENTVKTTLSIEDPRRDEPSFKVVRRLKTVILLGVLNELDKLRDPKFDPKDRPEWGVSPPLPHNLGVTRSSISDRTRPIDLHGTALYNSGIAPSSITDPFDRKLYEEAIRLNEEKRAHYQVQTRLNYLDRRLVTDEQPLALVINYLGRVFDRTPEDTRELTDLINDQVKSDTRRTELKKELLGKGGTH